MSASRPSTFVAALLTMALMLFAQWSSVMADSERKIDCRRIVFHPYCRGISAKRAATSAKLTLIEDEKDNKLMEDLWNAVERANFGATRDRSSHHRSNSMSDESMRVNQPQFSDYHIPRPRYSQTGSFRVPDPFYQDQMVASSPWAYPVRSIPAQRLDSNQIWTGSRQNSPYHNYVRVIEYYPERVPNRFSYQSGEQGRSTYSSRSPRHFSIAPYDLDYYPYRRSHH